MTVTAQKCLTELGLRAWSGFNADDMIFDSDDSLQARTELNKALRDLINKEDFPFRAKEYEIRTRSGNAVYSMPEGQITSIFNAETFERLKFLENGTGLDLTETGQPTAYWIDCNNPDEKIHLYPKPDKQQKYSVVYNQYKPVMNTEYETKFEFESAEDFINMPSNLEYLFMDCLVLKTMIQNNKDEQDENYRPTIDEFNESWTTFKRACQPSKTDNYFVIWD